MSVATEAAPALWTGDDLWAYRGRPGYRYELVEGELREMSPPGPEHGSVGQSLGWRATQFVEDNDLGQSFLAETGFYVRRNPDTVIAPDWAFIAKERAPERWPSGYGQVVPDLVLEVRSPGDTRKEIADKIALWLAAGVRLLWDLDPKRRVVTVHRPGEPPRELGVDDTLSGEDLLPGFSLPLRRIFR